MEDRTGEESEDSGRETQTHTEQSADETEKKAYCEGELGKKDAEKTKVEDTLKSLEAAIDFKTTEIESLENKIKSTEKSVYQVKENLEEAEKIRKEENKAYEASSKDRQLAVKVLKQAKAVLGQFYETQDNSAGLIQISSPKAKQGPNVTLSDRPDTFTHSSRKDVASQGVLDLMDMIAEGIRKEQDTADTTDFDLRADEKNETE